MNKATGKTQGVMLKPNVANTLIEMALLHKGKQLGTGGNAVQPLPINPAVVSVRNLTGDDLPRGSVVDLGTYLLAIDTDTRTDAEHLWLQGNTPAAGGSFGILTQALPDNRIGECQLAGVCIARVDFSDIAHRFARPKVGETYLESSGNAGPVEILAKPETGTGVQECIVWLRAARTAYIAKNGGSTIAARSGTTPGSGTVTLYYIDSSNVLTSLGVTVTAYNLAGSTVAADAWLQVKLESGSGKWLVDWEDCG